jgi:hypothetical protein
VNLVQNSKPLLQIGFAPWHGMHGWLWWHEAESCMRSKLLDRILRGSVDPIRCTTTQNIVKIAVKAIFRAGRPYNATDALEIEKPLSVRETKMKVHSASTEGKRC